MKIVKFKNEKYGIRMWFFGYIYIDLSDDTWHKRNWEYFDKYCMDDLCHVSRKWIELHSKKNKDYGEPYVEPPEVMPEPEPQEIIYRPHTHF